MNILLSSAYLPPVQYFARMLQAQTIYIEQHDHYVKQTYRNRCSIVSANGAMTLTIPVEKLDGKCFMRDVRIAEHGNWRHLHWQSIVSAYGSSPFFEYYEYELRPFYHERKFTFLFDMNEALRELIFSWIDLDVNICYTNDYRTELSPDEVDLRERIHPKKDWNTDTDFQPEPYYQVFDAKLGFTPNQSIIDLVFNMGNESILVLQRCAGR